MRFFRKVDTGEIYGLHLEARDTLEEMAARAPMTMTELAEKIENIIEGAEPVRTVDYDEMKEVTTDAVEDYKRGLVIQLNAWALEEDHAAMEGKGMLKPGPLLRRVAEKIEKEEL